MYIIIIGGGKVGQPLVAALLNAGHEVFVIEKDPRKVESLMSGYGEMALKGDGSEPNVLMQAGITRADILIATTGSDEDNLVACQVAKRKFGVARTIALTNNPHHETLFDLLGIDVTVNSTQVILAQIQEELPERVPVHVLAIRGNREIIVVEIPPASDAIGMALGELDLPPDTTITAVITQDGTLKSLDANTVLEIYDEVVALTTADNAENLLEGLTQEG